MIYDHHTGDWKIEIFKAFNLNRSVNGNFTAQIFAYKLFSFTHFIRFSSNEWCLYWYSVKFFFLINIIIFICLFSFTLTSSLHSLLNQFFLNINQNILLISLVDKFFFLFLARTRSSIWLSKGRNEKRKRVKAIV